MNSAAGSLLKSRAGDRGSEARAMAPCDQDRNQLDPFASRYVQSLARPGGRVTGVFLRQTDCQRNKLNCWCKPFPAWRAWACCGMPFR